MSTDLKNYACGRPPSDGVKGFHETELHDFLMANLPEEFTMQLRVNAKKLADSTGYARYHIYRHISDNRLSPKLAGKIIKLSSESTDPAKKGIITPESLARFVIEL